jgi:hypothetical protein
MGFGSRARASKCCILLTFCTEKNRSQQQLNENLMTDLETGHNLQQNKTTFFAKNMLAL